MLGRRPWGATLAHYTGWAAPDLWLCVQSLADCHVRLASKDDLGAVREKYLGDEYYRVAEHAPVQSLRSLLAALAPLAAR